MENYREMINSGEASKGWWVMVDGAMEVGSDWQGGEWKIVVLICVMKVNIMIVLSLLNSGC